MKEIKSAEEPIDDRLLIAIHDPNTGVSDDLAREAIAELRRLLPMEKRVLDRCEYYKDDEVMNELMEYLRDG